MYQKPRGRAYRLKHCVHLYDQQRLVEALRDNLSIAANILDILIFL